MSISRFRSRQEYHPKILAGTTYYWYMNAWKAGTLLYVNSTGMWPSRWEECSDLLNPGPPYRTGGPFYLKRMDIPLIRVATGEYIHEHIYRYYGSFYCDPYTGFSTSYNNLSSGSAEGYGAKGWNMFRPVKPVNSLGQFIAELRDAKSMVTGLRRRLRSLKDAGHHYLNFQFGWKPFLSDLQSFLSNGQKIARRMDYIRRNNGKWVKRGGTILKDISPRTNVVSNNRILPLINSWFYPGGIPTKPSACYVVTETRAWFEAMMKYYIPNLDQDQGKDLWSSPLLRKMWGLELTPSLVWELLPWSWLVDWFFDVGDFYSNLSNSFYDNCVAKYAYVMKTTKSILHIDQVQPLSCGGELRVDDAQFELVSKERAHASPFGFSFLPDWSNLSGRQIAILAALGVTKIH